MPRLSPLERYNSLLQKYPLLTKSFTGAILSAIGELISQWLTVRGPEKLKKLKLIKVACMLLYGATVNAPINHYGYKWIQDYTIKKVDVKWRKIAQLGASWFIVSPVQVFGLLMVLTTINSEKRITMGKIQNAIKNRYVPMLSSSLVSSTVLISVAQRYISPEKWSVFFSFAYACLGVGQNVYLKLNK